MKIIIGLGNPGKKYEKTRHNIGFLFLDFLAKNLAPQLKWQEKKSFQAQILKMQLEDKEIYLIKPQTFMNSSGLTVLSLKKKFPNFDWSKDFWVIHDDLDLIFGRIKISFGASSAGHKGVESIINSLNSKNFWRLRLGIGPTHKPSEIFVLEKFSPEEEKKLNEIFKRGQEALILALENPSQAMNLFNR